MQSWTKISVQKPLPRFVADEDETRGIVKDALLRKDMSEETMRLLSQPPSPEPITQEDIDDLIQKLNNRHLHLKRPASPNVDSSK